MGEAAERPGDAEEILAILRAERERRKAAHQPYGTQGEIAEALGVSFGYVSQWESAFKKPPDVRQWVDLLEQPRWLADLYDVYMAAERIVDEMEERTMRGRFSKPDRRAAWKDAVEYVERNKRA